MAKDEDESADLTGVWQGRYGYDIGAPECEFTATLIHTGSNLTGTIHEPDVLGQATSPVLYALVEGACSGAAVRFTKTYDGTGGWAHGVRYEGELTDGGHEIRGMWTIPGEARGGFVMARPRKKARSVTRKVAEKVGADG